MDLEKYLRQELSTSTASRYGKDIAFFFSLERDPKTANYSRIMEVVKELRDRYDNPKTINRILSAIRKYYDYLLYTGQREDHPCEHVYLRDIKREDIHLQDLFTEKELALLLTSDPDRYKRYRTDGTRNKLIMSFLIYQGLTREETSSIKTGQLNLEKGEIHVPGYGRQSSRTLPLKATQIHLIYQYNRPCNESKRLFIGQRGKALTGDAIRRIVRSYKYLFPDRQLSCSTIRMSVCRNLLRSGKDLRAVQVYMGHKYPSSTERYKASNMEELKAAIQKYHPLK